MFKKINLKVVLFVLFLIVIFSFQFSNIKLYVKNNLSTNSKNFIKEKFLFYYTIDNQKKDIQNKGKQISKLKKDNKRLKYQLMFLKSQFDNGKLIQKNDSINVGLNKFNTIRKYQINDTNKELYKSEEDFSGSFYVEKFNQKIILNFSNGNVFFFDEKDLDKHKLDIKYLKSNLKSFLDNTNERDTTSKIRDSLVINDKIYVSYVKRIKKGCFNTSILYSKINFQYIEFEEYFTYPECINTNIVTIGTGGRIEKVFNEKLLLTTGDQLQLYPAQDPTSMFGKTILIDRKTRKFKIATMGHKNPQGLVYSNLHNLIFSSEHQSKGGDEINLLKISENKIFNYGWAISSYGDHYSYVTKKDRKKYPLYKSHKKYGFEEPLIHFSPAIAPSELVIEYEDKDKIHFILSTLRDESLYELEYSVEKNKIFLGKKTIIGQRIRDLYYSKDYILLSLEGNSALAIIKK
jgi:hypothetical protein